MERAAGPELAAPPASSAAANTANANDVTAALISAPGDVHPTAAAPSASSAVETPSINMMPPQVSWSTLSRCRCDAHRSAQRMLTRTSTRVCGAPGGITLNRKRAPSRTPAGTRSLSSCVDDTSPPPPHGAHHSCQSRRARRIAGRCAEAARPAARLCPRMLPAGSARSRRSSPTDRRFAEERVAHPVEHARHRREVDGHLIRQPLGAAVPVAGSRCEPQPAVVRSTPRSDRSAPRRRGTPRGTPRRGRLPRCPGDTAGRVAGTRA